ncbi:N-formylglutamate amidohydrolase [Acidiphilium multivorum AIU301]|uniref:N-formylglutamate amidohydrolase n=1 Tax=Acidiphilium multivorum (strain DSM 11245 / JCM 8867 / NBRC 100883 / AIU 301) TaxID=926570 RepID=F0IZD3_ACIMA|nr:N-formylglutamate amidohydrolase [Acidiphilium multivorum]BAJ81143.1 N-formylglutamate amidohydrolase [Acidiphilium multivorum AIU301]GAN73377.1 N-formylglutamate amidohydrolase [Acidiphilium multivorum AIU301]
MDLVPPRPEQDAAACADGELPPCVLTRPPRQSAPVVVASPHSGRAYAPDFLALSRLDARALRKSEDGFVDELCAGAPGLGLPLLAARFPRAWCDVNREPWELDPAMFEDALPPYVNATSPRVAAGLGTIARVVASGEPIYRRKLRFAEAQARIEACWRPYRAALAGLIAETRAAFGACLLLDIHSMPRPPGLPHGHGPDIVVGDLHGASCARPVVQLVEQALRGEGFAIRRNDPYAGGYVTRHYGRPREHVHVVQIEIARALYMDEATMLRLPGFAALQASLTRILARVAAAVPALV